MKDILLVAPKTYRGRFDISFWNFYLPLLEMGYSVDLFDTFRDNPKDIDANKYRLIFCILTGDPNFREPSIAQLQKWSSSPNITTLNWFCDDSWRFWDFSTQTCLDFNYVVTTEPVFADKYKELGYDNAILSNWHANPTVHVPTDFKTRDVCFIGAMTRERKDYILALEDAGIRIEYNESGPLSFEDMCLMISSSKISLNFSKNHHNNETQMKARLFEVPALKTLLVTEYHPGIEDYYTDKEIVTFKTSDEMVKKVEGLLQNPNIISKMTENGYQRFLKDHTSHKRLQEVLDVVLR